MCGPTGAAGRVGKRPRASLTGAARTAARPARQAASGGKKFNTNISFIFWCLILPSCRLAFGCAYPAYECYKTVELNKPEIEQLIFCCLLTVSERFGDFTISWLPFYSEAKLMFFVYLWYPKTKGTTYIYGTFFRPYISQHENEINRNLLELRARATTDTVVLYLQKAASVFFDVLKYVADQSPHQVWIKCTIMLFL
uniref:HVA22-like protein n=1 Tax=Setaria viridis TaxID=4556 RepID=A0A4U6V4I2_SETVI|nr:hypothetical protein SEVIR_3G028600v2 [Setaria viridis]